MKGVFDWEDLGGYNAWLTRRDTKGYAVATIWRFFTGDGTVYTVQIHIFPSGQRKFEGEDFCDIEEAKTHADDLLTELGFRFLPDELKVLL
jgi:hypothetical protein